MRSNYDVVVVGGGPVGSVAAISAARAGKTVLLLEANPGAAHRFAGEWLHPTAVGVLDRLRIGRLESARPRTGYGFAVFPDDGSAPVELPFPAGQIGLAAEHSEFVSALRKAVGGCTEITYLEHARVTGVTEQLVTFRHVDREHSVRAERVIGADGRNSLMRKVLGLPAQGDTMSYMASVTLRGVSLPLEGYGHVLLGGPGPVLLYRIGDDVVRGCFDVPLGLDQSRRNPTFLWDAFARVLPDNMRTAFRNALEAGPVLWAVNRFSPRASYGQGRIWLAGDAVGHFHPLTAAGLTLGFLDAELAGQGAALADYQRTRERDTYVPELLSNALYHVFARDDRAAAQIRSAVCQVWRADPEARARTMRILTCAEPSRRAFGASFLQVAARALSSNLGELVEQRRLAALPDALASYREWARWPAASLVPSAARKTRRAKATSAEPPTLAALFGVPAEPEAVAHVDVPVRSVLEVDVEAALDAGSEALLGELRRLHERIGQEADFALVRRATRVVEAIDEANVNGGMHARMRLAKRPMARIGMASLLDAHEADPQRIGASDVASFMISLLSAREPERVERLEDGIRHLVSCQHADGGFSEHAGDEPASLQTTELCCRALALCAKLHDAGSFRYEEVFARARSFLLAQQRDDGSFPPSELEGSLSNTCSALRALLAARLNESAPELRRATRFVCGEQSPSGAFLERSDERAESAQLTARAVHALLDAPGPHFGVVQRAIVPLTARLLDRHVPALLAGEPGAAERTASLVHALARYAAQERARPKLGDQATAAEEDLAFCRESLEAVSRTFSKPIQMLPRSLELAVTCGYLLCRVADTVEDHPAVPRDRQDELFARFLDIVERGASAREFAQAFAEIPGVDAELTLARELPRVMRVFSGLPGESQRIIARWVAEMSRGMSLYTHREAGADGFVALHTVEDLERYCYYVAGTVGHMLTELFAVEFGSKASREMLTELREHAESFGEGLQLVNILKDVTDDRERNWSFVPRASTERVGLGIADLTDSRNRARAHAAVEPLFSLAARRLDRGLDYALAIPAEHKGIRLFCLLPLWMAALTLVHARGNDAMFADGQEVKISRAAVERVIAECIAMVSDDAKLRAAYRELWQPPVALEQGA